MTLFKTAALAATLSVMTLAGASAQMEQRMGGGAAGAGARIFNGMGHPIGAPGARGATFASPAPAGISPRIGSSAQAGFGSTAGLQTGRSAYTPAPGAAPGGFDRDRYRRRRARGLGGAGIAAGAAAGVAAGLAAGGYYNGGYYDGGYDTGYYDGSYGYGSPDYSYGYGDGAPADQVYSNGGPVTADNGAGGSCTTPVKTCQLYTPSDIGNPCSCRTPGGRAQGEVTP